MLWLHEMVSATAPDLVALFADTVDILAEYQTRLGVPELCELEENLRSAFTALGAVTKLRRHPARWLSNWMENHPNLVPKLKGWVSKWEARYPSVRAMIAGAADAHRAALAETQRIADNRALCDGVVVAIHKEMPSMKSYNKLDKTALVVFKEKWNNRLGNDPIRGTTKKEMLASAASVLRLPMCCG